MPPIHTWQLFVDESGDFDRAEDVVAAGVLMHAYDTSQLRLRLQHALQRAVPLGPYPPHAAHLNLPTWLPLASTIHVTDNPEGHQLDRLVAPARRLLQSSNDTAADTALEACRAAAECGDPVPWPLVQLADRWFETAHPDPYRALEIASRQVSDAMVQLLHRVSSQCLDNARCFVVAAWSPASESNTRNRYLDLLETLCERAFVLMASHDPPIQQLHAQIVSRWVDGARALNIRDIGNAARAASVPLGFEPHVSFFPRPPARYRDNVHPGIVLADFVANRLKRVLRGDPNWERVTQRAQLMVALPVSHPPRLAPSEDAPAVAANGAPRKVIRHAFAGQQVTGGLEDLPRWASEQAATWVGLAQAIHSRQEVGR